MSGRTSSTANAETVSRVNQTAILDALRQHGPLSRQEIGARTGLSAATVNRLAGHLLRRGLVVTDGHQPSTGGRPSILLRYSGRANLVSVLHVGATRTEGALVDFDGAIVHRVQRPVVPDVLHAADRATIRLEEALSVVTELGAAADGRGQPSQAIGVAVPGVAGADGRVTWAPALDWREVPVGSLLRDRTGLPVVVENDANVLAVGEHHRGAGRGVQDLVAVVLGTGIGTGIVTGGRLHRGSRAAAGEIGYMLLDRTSLARLFPGFGDLESRVGSAGLTRQARERGIAAPGGRPLTAADVFDLVRDGSVEARALLEETLDYVALAVANLCTVLDPELVIVGGEMGGAADLITPGLRDRLVGRIPHVPRLAASELGDDAVIIGAAELAARLVSDSAYVQATR
ncbi:ROK family transcriptional regulator [Jiangella alkaliphila]|uniref:Sugar kinase of the NBD/HSP70 family, may contain an N-terminal HTH domain n=1 Tax=Jiangella alkaliphila TaxID=419479 RepID=A0A1H2K8L9_9ACTN|nr:ROK family transcriptional regulator [Jiangella alkaliphila]SDU64696.1 Sugar kinase of the NBD/HSP70 family, may contain an N-terminal HTH domain [Jiangella alkaliphila]